MAECTIKISLHRRDKKGLPVSKMIHTQLRVYHYIVWKKLMVAFRNTIKGEGRKGDIRITLIMTTEEDNGLGYNDISDNISLKNVGLFYELYHRIAEFMECKKYFIKGLQKYAIMCNNVIGSELDNYRKSFYPIDYDFEEYSNVVKKMCRQIEKDEDSLSLNFYETSKKTSHRVKLICNGDDNGVKLRTTSLCIPTLTSHNIVKRVMNMAVVAMMIRRVRLLNVALREPED